MTPDRKMEAWDRLVQGKPVDDVGLDLRNGRLDLRGVILPDPVPVKRFRTSVAEVVQLSRVTTIKGAHWSGLDLSSARLNHVLFIDGSIDNCVFDRCSYRNGGIWATIVSNTSFRSADLRDSALGGLEKGRRNVFREVDFTEADLRGTAYSSADFISCLFRNTRLDKVDFEGSRFIECTFEGELREVIFDRHGFDAKHLPPNEMALVDFSRAQLRWCEFRRLDLDTVRFPEDGDHIIVNDYPEVLDRLLRAYAGRTDLGSRQLCAVLDNRKKWVGPRQCQGIFNKHDLIQMVGEEGLKAVLEILQSVGPPE